MNGAHRLTELQPSGKQRIGGQALADLLEATDQAGLLCAPRESSTGS